MLSLVLAQGTHAQSFPEQEGVHALRIHDPNDNNLNRGEVEDEAAPQPAELRVTLCWLVALSAVLIRLGPVCVPSGA